MEELKKASSCSSLPVFFAMGEQNFTRPIRLQRVEIGGLVTSDQYLYLNKVTDYQSDNLCSVTLIAF